MEKQRRIQMNFRLLVIFAACSVAFAETGTELFQKAVVQERAAGNLEEAIKIYQRVAREYPKDRPLAAKALVQAARCYEKLGQDKAIKLYGQVISEFGDQRELAAVSRERLAALTPPKANSSAGMVARQIPTRVSSLQPFESDGRRLFNVDRGDLMVAAMDGSNAKTIFASENSGGRGRIMSLPSISRDGSRAAFKLSRATDAICVVGSDGSGFRQIFDFGRRTPALLGGWSHDGRYLLAFVIEPDAPSGSLVSISVADGSVRKLVNGGLPSPQTRLFEPPLAQFSPDGRYVAYSKGGGRIGKPEAPQPERGVYIVSADGVNQGHFAEQPGAAVLLDWTADGRYILFVGNRTGVPAIYAQAVAGGKPQGDPILIKQDAGEVWKGFMSKDGSLLYSVTGSQGELRVLSLDPRNKGVSGAGERFPLKFKESPMGAAWSADGRMVAYSLTTQRAGEHRLVIRTLDTGQERELTLPGPGGTIEWARDGSTVYESSAPRHTVESITLADGAVRQIATFDKALRSIMATADGKALLIELNSLERTDASIVRHDLETEVDTVMVSKPLAFRLAVSPDGTRVAAIDRDPDGNQSVSVKPATGGEWNRLATLGTSGGQQLWWTADSAGLIISRGRSQARSLWGVSVADGAAVQLTEFPPEGRINVIAIRPDGEQVLLLAQESPAELWALENFGSKLQRTR
jgi:Tol biopolymer transport system component